MRFLHTADWQLGMTRHFLSGEAQPRYSAARRGAVTALGPLAAETGAEFVVVAGDVFEHNQLAPREVSQSLEAMRGIGVPVYLLPGNHDPLDAASVYTSALFTAERPDNVIVLDRPGVHQVRPGLELVAAPWSSKFPTTDLVAQVLDGLPGDGVTRIVVGHGAVDILVPDKDRASLIGLAALEAALDRGAVHYVALGDKHSVFEVGSSGRVWYSGAPEVTNFDDVEPDPGNVLVVDIDESDAGRPVRVDPRRVGTWRFLSMRHSVDTSRDVADLDINLDLMPDKERTVIRLGLTGSLTVTDKAALDVCLDRYARVFAALVPWDRQTDIAVMPADGEFDDLGIGGFAASAVDELVATARTSGEDAEDARAALALLLRLTEGGAA
ncbi:DNA repair exonuclease [Mycolicibacterium chubuense]|uniref:Nuclease SbcCD subunit D n=1 Tax=Mycolicibacterium chubuense TaxID=1800 RepID=A0A0J6WDY4_MYCCU|nr:exonuclease SbcCD subunit D [Mycolicibacterium chubuense]KMO80173.1 exonuclease subunit SbcD [Mycolicibacterium chubuense]ORA54693.1 DNA repair exonuclease [Mycolicibacterium chubuense]SPY45503.1 DNA repair exonuclease [Mycolicibacterium chubuense]